MKSTPSATAPSGKPSRIGRLSAAAIRTTMQPVVAIVPGNRAGAAIGRALIWVLLRGFAGWVPAARRVRVTGPTGAVDGEWVGGTGVPGRGIVYYLHGSAFFACSPSSHRGLTTEIARRLGRPVFAASYRKAPEHRYPAGHIDARNGYLWLLAQGFEPEDIIVMGDSAGGHLALSLCAWLREERKPMPRAVVGFSPFLGASALPGPDSEATLRDPVFTVRQGRRLTGLYFDGIADNDPRVDMTRMVGPDLPPLLFQVGQREVLLPGIRAFAAAQRAAGGHCTVTEWAGMFHVFQLGYLLLPEAGAALTDVERFVAALESKAAHSA